MEVPGGSSCGVSLSIYSITAVMLLSCVLCSAHGIGGNETDRLALLEFRANMVDSLGVMRSWNSSIHFCQWDGITCGRRHQRVTALNLSSQNLLGVISPHIGNLSFLRTLDLQRNSLLSRIPPEVGRLSRLQHLLLNNNSLRGEIPPSLSNCSSLVRIGLGGNMLTGEVPEKLDSLSNLKRLWLQFNNLTGGIPLSFGNLTSLVDFRLNRNNFAGRIPDKIGNLQNMQILFLGRNNFVGTIPSSFFNSSSVEILDVTGNQLEGVLPWDLGFTLPNLAILCLSSNHFTGPIPQSISNLSNLRVFQIPMNNFIGDVPSFKEMSRLVSFEIGYNHLGGRQVDDPNFLCSLTNSTRLEGLFIQNNSFRGIIPNCLGNLPVTLNSLGLSSNALYGSLPGSIGNLINLERLLLDDNSISGIIPSEIGNLRDLKQLRLDGNKFSGQIPQSLGNLLMLTELSMRNNSLRGSIPSSISNCKSLELLDVASNKLSGTIPPVIMSLPALTIYADFSQNNFGGTIPTEVGNLKNLGSLQLSSNNFSGEIPSSLGSCVMLEYLYLQDNMLEGSIPSYLNSLKGIRLFNFSNNRLSGQIPKFLENLPLESLDLSFNEFEGALPEGGIFKNASAVSVGGNEKLCGGLPEFKLPKCNIRETKKTGITDKVRIIVSSVSGLLGIALAVLLLYVFWFRKERKAVDSNCTDNDLWKVSYQGLLKATDGFSSANLIGEGSFGSVFRGVLDKSQTTVAIKVLNLTRHGASKSFMAECEALRNTRHRNLVKVLTACSGTDYQGNDFKALVYQFMVNGSLDEWLHPVATTSEAMEGSPRHLGILQRLNIAVDVGCALDYLHHGGEIPIVHCDLKPSNVLLDDEMVAHVGDFGLVRFLPEVTAELIAAQSSSMGVKGSLGYIAPGGQISTYGDVYSYGILILEMFTGKRPTNEMFRDGLSLRYFVMASLPEQVLQVVDPVLLPECTEPEQSHNSLRTGKRSGNRLLKIRECLVSLMEMGVACSSESPRDRMTITDVAAALQVIRKKLVGVDANRSKEKEQE
ncbi:hypothetical protein CDL15_Pgr027601 [Punica granatum]|uniref:non-specific serine/threonine protein kinase n=1 Tax=Punica granatum TaxID=22663 RepID=A0A218XIS3_PUNGR|nr:hypothetical protein CDL15_Pgr027601 [Punica granatum]